MEPGHHSDENSSGSEVLSLHFCPTHTHRHGSELLELTIDEGKGYFLSLKIP